MYARWWQGQRSETKNDSDDITSILDKFDIDLRLTVSALATMAYVSIWTVFRILPEYLNMSKCTCTTYAEGQRKGEACEIFEIVFKTLWKRMRTKYEAIRVPIERYRLHQDNSPPHKAASTLLELDVLGFRRVDHLPYSPYLSAIWFWCIP